MTKRELAKKLADRAELDSIVEGERVIDAIEESITDELASGGTVTLRGFGTFTTSERKARKGRNPRTGESIQIEAHRVAKFTPANDLKDAANSSYFGPDWLLFKDISSRVAHIKDKIDLKVKGSDQLSKEAKQYLDKAQTVYEDISEQIKNASDSSGKAWTDIKSGLEKAFGELKDAWSKAKEHF